MSSRPWCVPIRSGLLEDLDVGVRLGLLEARDGAYGFRHAIVREVLDASTTSPRRALLHREAARVLSGIAGIGSPARRSPRAAERCQVARIGGAHRRKPHRRRPVRLRRPRWRSPPKPLTQTTRRRRPHPACHRAVAAHALRSGAGRCGARDQRRQRSAGARGCRIGRVLHQEISNARRHSARRSSSRRVDPSPACAGTADSRPSAARDR